MCTSPLFAYFAADRRQLHVPRSRMLQGLSVRRNQHAAGGHRHVRGAPVHADRQDPAMTVIDMHSHWGTRRGYPFQTPDELAQQERVFKSKPSYVTESEMAEIGRASCRERV